MPTNQRAKKNLPPLEVGQLYQATDFEYFEYVHERLPGTGAILRLHLKNGTSIDLPTTDNELKRLLAVLIGAFGEQAKKVMRDIGWWPKE